MIYAEGDGILSTQSMMEGKCKYLSGTSLGKFIDNIDLLGCREWTDDFTDLKDELFVEG